jgi:nucleoside-diphosphate-sugar epimerase
MSWYGKKVLVTGGAGFIGSHTIRAVLNRGAGVRVADSLEISTPEDLGYSIEDVEFMKTDLRNPQECTKVCSGIDVVLNLAAKVAGVAYNSVHPAEMFTSNTVIGLNMLEAARKHDIERFLVVSSACVYRRNCSVPTPETEGFLEDPEPSNLGYGWAKRLLEVQGRTYFEEYGMKIAIVRPFNTYGPRDHFDIQYGHVIPSLIRKTIEGRNPLIVWGDGSQTRSFVYVTDVVEGMLSSVERYACADPVNIGNNEEISVGDLARLIVRLSGKDTNLQFDDTKPSGQPRRAPDLTKAREKLNFEASIRLKDGLKNTIDWYRSTVAEPPLATMHQA